MPMMPTKPTPSRLRPGSYAPAARHAAFTAVEMSAVVTIILILALILIPIVRNRVEEAKIVAAQDDMAAIEKAQLFAYSYTNHYFRLQDLARPAPKLDDPNLTAAQRAIELRKLPPAYWNEPVTNQANLIENWKGPFLAMHRTETVDNLLTQFPYLFRGTAADPRAQQGPILIVPEDRQDWIFPNDFLALTRARYPIDPWGNPYLFFGPGRMGDLGGANAVVNETDFGTAVIYSLGPDGLAGSAPIPQVSAMFFREAGILGTGDDLTREF